MAEIVISVGAKFAEYSGQVIRQGLYLFCVGKIKRNLESTKKELTSTWNGVEQRVADALIRTEVVDDVVKQWLNDVKSVMEEVKMLEPEMKGGCCCCRGCCPTLMSYLVCKELVNKTQQMGYLSLKGKYFDRVSKRAPIPDLDYFSSGDFVYFESTKLSAEQLLKALRDDSIYRIGLYGMGGCGKTALAIKVGKQAHQLKLFDRVVLACVSTTVNLKSIQCQIADVLNFTFKSETESGRARELSLRLQRGERILFILDGVWAKLNLEDIGIALDDNHKGCKVLLTTRGQQVCTLMECQLKIELSLLSEEESWTLFQKHAHIVDDSSSMLLNVAREVARECKGLPIAIVTVASSLKGSSLDEWKVALHQLSKPSYVEEGMRNNFSAAIQLSYDNLSGIEAKLFLLMCSMFPKDHEISIEDLFRYGTGLGIYKEVDSLEMARHKVNATINELLSSCLLLTSDRKKCLRMHDIICDAALWIASKQNSTIMTDLKALSEDGSMENCYAISLWHKEIDQFPQQLDAPKLQILLLNSRHKLNFSYASFEGVKELKVMAVINDNYYNHRCLFSLPQSTQWFINLQTLRLVGQVIGDISFVVSIRRLKILDLQGSKFKELPNGIENLNELKLLDLSSCKIEEDCYEVIGRCSQLEELYMFTIALPLECFLYNTFPKLERYRLKIGRSMYLEHLRARAVEFRGVQLGDLNISTSGASIQYLLQRAGLVSLHGLEGGCKSIIPEMVQAVGKMNELITLALHSCSEIECIIDATTSDHANSSRVDVEFPQLVHLQLEKMDNLKQVCRGPPLLCNLSNLKTLEIVSCPMLTSLFPISVARTLHLLEELCVDNCSELMHIVDEGQNGNDRREEIVPVSNNSDLMFPQLKILKVTDCHKLECMFPTSCSQGLVQLEQISICDATKLKYVVGEHNSGYVSSYQNEVQIMLPLLKDLTLKRLPNLLNICPDYFQSRWPSLRRVFCEDCPKLTSSCNNSMLALEKMGLKVAVTNTPNWVKKFHHYY